MIKNYLAPVLYEGSLSRQTEDGYSSLVGSVVNLTCDSMSYCCLSALHDLSSRSDLWAFSLTLHLLPTSPFWSHPLQLLGHSYLLHILGVFVGKRGLTCMQVARYLLPTALRVCLWVSVTLGAVLRFTCLYLHMVPGGLSSYTLRTGSARTDGHDIYGVIRCVPIMMVFDVGTQLHRWPVIMCRPNPRAGGGCYLYSSKFVHVKVG